MLLSRFSIKDGDVANKVKCLVHREEQPSFFRPAPPDNEISGSLWCGMSDGSIQVLHLRKTRLQAEIQRHGSSVNCMADINNRLWSGSDDGTICVSEFKISTSRKERQYLEKLGRVTTITPIVQRDDTKVEHVLAATSSGYVYIISAVDPCGIVLQKLVCGDCGVRSAVCLSHSAWVATGKRLLVLSPSTLECVFSAGVESIPHSSRHTPRALPSGIDLRIHGRSNVRRAFTWSGNRPKFAEKLMREKALETASRVAALDSKGEESDIDTASSLNSVTAIQERFNTPSPVRASQSPSNRSPGRMRSHTIAASASNRNLESVMQLSPSQMQGSSTPTKKGKRNDSASSSKSGKEDASEKKTPSKKEGAGKVSSKTDSLRRLAKPVVIPHADKASAPPIPIITTSAPSRKYTRTGVSLAFNSSGDATLSSSVNRDTRVRTQSGGMTTVSACTMLCIGENEEVWACSETHGKVHVWNTSEHVVACEMTVCDGGITWIKHIKGGMWMWSTQRTVYCVDAVTYLPLREIHIKDPNDFACVTLSKHQNFVFSSSTSKDFCVWVSFGKGRERLHTTNNFPSTFVKDSERSSDGLSQVPAPATSFDRYGFQFDEECVVYSCEELAKSLPKAKLASVENRAVQVQSLQQEWEELFNMCGDPQDFFQHEHSFHLLIQRSVPDMYRPTVWSYLINKWVDHIRKAVPETYYSQLAIRVTPGCVRQIELDLPRTFPTNKFYNTTHATAISKLRTVLCSYALHNPDVGYCQGFNFIAGFLLLFLKEEDAFWGLVAIVDNIMGPEYYVDPMLCPRAHQRLLVHLLRKLDPVLHDFFSSNFVDISLVTFQWFFTLFIDCVSMELVLAVWDSLLFEGSVALFRYSLAVLFYFREDLLALKSRSKIMTFLKTIRNRDVSIPQIIEIAFHIELDEQHIIDETDTLTKLIDIEDNHQQEIFAFQYMSPEEKQRHLGGIEKEPTEEVDDNGFHQDEEESHSAIDAEELAEVDAGRWNEHVTPFFHANISVRDLQNLAFSEHVSGSIRQTFGDHPEDDVIVRDSELQHTFLEEEEEHEVQDEFDSAYDFDDFDPSDDQGKPLFIGIGNTPTNIIVDSGTNLLA